MFSIRKSLGSWVHVFCASKQFMVSINSEDFLVLNVHEIQKDNLFKISYFYVRMMLIQPNYSDIAVMQYLLFMINYQK